MGSKKLLILIIIVIAGCFLTACNDEETTEAKYTLPDLTGKTIDNYMEHIDDEIITVVVRKEHSDSIEVDEFIRYGDNLTAGQKVEHGEVVYLYFSIGPKIVDEEGPEFFGIEDVEIEFASDYFEKFDPKKGVTVIDNVDGTIDEKFWRVDGANKINYYKIGTYELVYTAMDSSQNITVAKRKVTVVPLKELDTRYTDSLELDVDYVGKSFLNDGIGIVKFDSCIDGDTAYFREGTTRIYLRFLGIDTPESTPQGGYEPWGQAASKFTCDILKKANVIVLEGEGSIKDTYGRYMAWVWVDGRLLNLELVEEAYTTINLADSSKYYEYFSMAELKTKGSGKRVHGEDDPDFD